MVGLLLHNTPTSSDLIVVAHIIYFIIYLEFMIFMMKCIKYFTDRIWGDRFPLLSISSTKDYTKCDILDNSTLTILFYKTSIIQNS